MLSSSNTKEQGNLIDLCYWAKRRNSESRFCRFSADDVPYVQLSNRLSLLEVDQQSTGLLKHLENKVKPLVGKTKVRKEIPNCLELGTALKMDKCSQTA